MYKRSFFAARNMIDDCDMKVLGNDERRHVWAMWNMKRRRCEKNLQTLMSLYEVVIKGGSDVVKFIFNITCKQNVICATSTLTNLQTCNYSVPHALEWNNRVHSLMNEQWLQGTPFRQIWTPQSVYWNTDITVWAAARIPDIGRNTQFSFHVAH